MIPWEGWSRKSSFERIVYGVVAGIAFCMLFFGSYSWVLTGSPFIFSNSIGYIALLAVVPMIISHIGILPIYNQSRILVIFYLMLLGVLVFNGLGALGWYRVAFHYDDFVHFISPCCIVIMFSVWNLTRLSRTEKYSDVAIALWAMAGAVCVVAIIWEPIEIVVDALFGVKTSGQDGQALDTLYDILMDMIGIMTGRVIMQYLYTPMLRWLRIEK